MIGPTINHICNHENLACEFLDAWYNGGMEVHGRCKKEVWKGIKSWSPKGGCNTPKNCPFLNQKKEK